jgi:hypothetical protein
VELKCKVNKKYSKSSKKIEEDGRENLIKKKNENLFSTRGTKRSWKI